MTEPGADQGARPEHNSLADIARMAHGEIDRQFTKWGEQNHCPEYWWLIVSEEFGEVAKALCEGKMRAAQDEIIHLVACLAQTHSAIDRLIGLEPES